MSRAIKLFLMLGLVSACKTTAPRSASSVQSLTVEDGNQYEVFTPVYEQTEEGVSAGQISNICLQSCVRNQIDPKTGALDVTCKVKGHVDANQLIESGGSMSLGAQLLLKDVVAKDMRAVQGDEPEIRGAVEELRAKIALKEDSERVCRPQIKDAGLSLAGLYYHTQVYFNNRSSSTVELHVSALVLTTSGLFEQKDGAVFTIGAGQRGNLSIDGGNIFGSLKYRAYVGGNLVKSNGSGINFTSPSSGTYEFSVSSGDITLGSGGGGVATETGTGSGSLSSSVKECVSKLNRVYKRYPRTGATFTSARETEIRNCWAAADQAAPNWSKLMKVYYCEHPGQPIRACFTPTLLKLRQAGYDTETAYAAAFVLCKNNGSFDTMDATMLENFKDVMLAGWKSSDDNRCISEFGRTP